MAFPFTFAPMKKWMWTGGLLLLLACSEQPAKPVETKKEIAGAKTANDAGKQLFFNRCASCHMVNKDMTGPALKGVESRWPDQQKLYGFIRNSDSVIQRDAYARQLWLDYNQTAMLPHPDLTDEQIRSILDYIQSVSE